MGGFSSLLDFWNGFGFPAVNVSYELWTIYGTGESKARLTRTTRFVENNIGEWVDN
jgi:hypothetical protein